MPVGHSPSLHQEGRKEQKRVKVFCKDKHALLVSISKANPKDCPFHLRYYSATFNCSKYQSLFAMAASTTIKCDRRSGNHVSMATLYSELGIRPSARGVEGARYLPGARYFPGARYVIEGLWTCNVTPTCLMKNIIKNAKKSRNSHQNPLNIDHSTR